MENQESIKTEEVKVEDTKYCDPELTMEHRAQVLLHQRQQLTIQLTIHKLQQQLEQAPAHLNTLLTKICTDLGIDPSQFTFDLDNLKITRKDK